MREDIEARIAEGGRIRSIKDQFVRDELQRPELFLDRIDAGRPVRFNTLSLPGWLRLAQLAGIPRIPYRTLGTAPVQSYIDLLDDKPSDFSAIARDHVSGLRQGEMLRMEQVAPYAIKSSMARGMPMHSGLEAGMLDLYDPRFADTLMDLHEAEILFMARPIIETEKVPALNGEGLYPAEFRVIVQGGRLIGITNYYPQCRMGGENHAAATEAIYLTSRLMAFMKKNDIAPASPAFPLHPDGPSFTVDFLHQKDGGVLFLEGGPPALQAAHPCCFLSEEYEIRGEPPLHGVALSLKDPLLPLRDIYPDETPSLEGLHQPQPDFTRKEGEGMSP